MGLLPHVLEVDKELQASLKILIRIHRIYCLKELLQCYILFRSELRLKRLLTLLIALAGIFPGLFISVHNIDLFLNYCRWNYQ